MGHYDVDVHCSACGRYWYSYYDEDPHSGEDTCEKCAKAIRHGEKTPEMVEHEKEIERDRIWREKLESSEKYQIEKRLSKIRAKLNPIIGWETRESVLLRIGMSKEEIERVKVNREQEHKELQKEEELLSERLDAINLLERVKYEKSDILKELRGREKREKYLRKRLKEINKIITDNKKRK